jgi:hypothetical protein
MASGIVVGGILLSGDELFRMKELTISSGPDLINNSWLQINKDSSRNMLAGSGFREEGVERVVAGSNGLVGGHLTVGLDAMFQAVRINYYFVADKIALTYRY